MPLGAAAADGAIQIVGRRAFSVHDIHSPHQGLRLEPMGPGAPIAGVGVVHGARDGGGGVVGGQGDQLLLLGLGGSEGDMGGEKGVGGEVRGVAWGGGGRRRVAWGAGTGAGAGAACLLAGASRVLT